MSLNIEKGNKKRIVIIGGGFSGLNLAKKLRNSGLQIVLIDKNNYHQFPPLIYQVASAGMEPSSISFPFRKILRTVTTSISAWENFVPYFRRRK